MTAQPLPPSPPVATPAPGRPRSILVAPDGTVTRDLAPETLAAIVKGAPGSPAGQLWVDVDVSDPAQAECLGTLFGFHPLSVEDALNPKSRVKIEEYAGYLFVMVREIYFQEATDDPYDVETCNLSFFLGPEFVVSARRGRSAAVASAAERIDRNADLLRRGAERVLHAIVDASVDAYFPLLDKVDDFIDGLEERVFANFDKRALQEIFAVKRLVLALRRHLAPQREVFNVLTNRPSPLLAPDAQLYFRDVYDHMLRINDSLDTYRDLLSSTLDAYLSQVSNRMGLITKGLSVIATVTLPFVILSGMWGMNLDGIPLQHHPHAFAIVFGIQLVVGLALLAILRTLRLL